jgi:hypothetical protein
MQMVAILAQAAADGYIVWLVVKLIVYNSNHKVLSAYHLSSFRSSDSFRFVSNPLEDSLG